MKEKSKEYIKKPVTIEAIQWTGGNLKEIIDFTGLNESALKWTWEEYEQVVKEKGLKIFTLEGPLMANIGDWIIKGIQGEFYPCKSDIFEATYIAASQQVALEREKAEAEKKAFAREMVTKFWNDFAQDSPYLDDFLTENWLTEPQTEKP